MMTWQWYCGRGSSFSRRVCKIVSEVQPNLGTRDPIVWSGEYLPSLRTLFHLCKQRLILTLRAAQDTVREHRARRLDCMERIYISGFFLSKWFKESL